MEEKDKKIYSLAVLAAISTVIDHYLTFQMIAKEQSMSIEASKILREAYTVAIETANMWEYYGITFMFIAVLGLMILVYEVCKLCRSNKPYLMIFLFFSFVLASRLIAILNNINEFYFTVF